MAGQLSSPLGKPLQFSADDVLWLSRAVESEGEPRDLVAQVLVNRWAWLSDYRPGAYPRLADLVRAYAQPVNPRWFPQGDLFLARLEKAPTSERAALLQQATRRQAQHSTRVQFSAATDQAVRQALTGPITIPAGALHYAAPTVIRKDLPLLRQGRPGVNTIWGESDGRGVGVLYSFITPGPSFPRAQLLEGRPHAVVAFLFLTGGALLGLRSLRRRK